MTDVHYERHYWGSEAHDYIREQLRWGDPLSKALESLPIEAGSVFSFLPQGFQLSGPNAFSRHQSWPADDPFPGVLLERAFVLNYLLGRKHSIALFRSIWRQSDLTTHKVETPYLFLDDSDDTRGALICGFLTHSEASEETVSDAIGGAWPHPFLSVLTSGAEKPETPQHGQKLPYSELLQLVARPDHVLVGAFEDEAYLIWSPPQAGP